MMDTDTSGMQERIGELCGQFKLPTVGAQSVVRFTAAGHGDALVTFLEVLEQEAEDRRQRRINRLRRESRLPSGKTWETPVFTGAGFSSTIGCPWPYNSNWPNWPWATVWWKPATPSSSLQPTAWCRACPCVGRGTPRRQARPGPAPPAAQAGQLRLPAPGLRHPAPVVRFAAALDSPTAPAAPSSPSCPTATPTPVS